MKRQVEFFEKKNVGLFLVHFSVSISLGKRKESTQLNNITHIQVIINPYDYLLSPPLKP